MGLPLLTFDDAEDIEFAAPLQWATRSCPVWRAKCGTSITASGSVHSSTIIPPTGIARNAFLARNTG